MGGYFEFEGDCSELNGNMLICNRKYILENVIKPSDGFILQESAINGNFNYPFQEMLGSNHMQMRNDSETEKAVRIIFEDSFGEGDEGFFYTEFR